MKNLLLVFLLTFTTVFSPAEKYYVTFIKGKVILSRTKSPVKVGDALNPDDKLIFGDKTSKISCISPGKGRFDITAQTAKIDSKGELLAVLKANLVPASGTHHLSTRSIMSEGNTPETYFSSSETEDRILLIENEPLAIKPSYKLDNSNFFFVQYTADNTTITRKIEHSQNGLIFSNKLFSTESGPIKDQVILCYQSNANGEAKSSIIAKFYPILVSKEMLVQQIELIKMASDSNDKKKQKAEIVNHLFENYGKISSEELTRVFGI
ncbi:hypothetical protein [Pedobacter foliorum]|uniref:hypothetical protein n=1 Tax=Pedobacter foliorum TaxID=2739058 RepID=UPI001562F0B0|nr:hypothetical protein [Pedobacter foliorum]NRF37964.1 hypothetical protein [Pedobacter foliorum]